MRLQGVITALITPFSGDALDLEGFKANIEEQIAAGIDGVMPLGSTGEAATLTRLERMEVIRTAVDTVRGRVPVIVGAGTNNTRETIELVAEASELGADALNIVVPYYNRPTQEGLFLHFEAVALSTSLPVVLYNVPGRTGTNLAPETVEKLSQIPNIVAIKEASGCVTQVAKILRCTDSAQFSVLSGDDALTLPFMAVGAHGIMSVVSNLVPEKMVALVRHIRSGDLQEAQRLHYSLMPLFEAAFFETNPMPIKEMMRLSGRPAGHCRLPLCSVRPETHKRLEKVLHSYDVSVARSR